MNKNSIIGLVLIIAIVAGFSLLNRPSEEQIEARKRYNDSISLVRQAEYERQVAAEEAQLVAQTVINQEQNDSSLTQQVTDAYGVFAPSAVGTEEFYTLENELLKLTISSKGGRIYAAELKKYRRHDSLPLILFDAKESRFGFTLVTNNNRVLNTADLYFTPVQDAPSVDADGNQLFIMRLQTSIDAYMDMVYRLPADNYMLQMTLESNQMNKVLALNTNSLELQWESYVRQQERSRSFEERYATLQYKFLDKEFENLSETKAETKSVSNRVKWIAFKDQFFSSVLIADEAFTANKFESSPMPANSDYIKSYKSAMTVAYDVLNGNPVGFKMYLGPNHYKTLSTFDQDVEKENKLYLNKLVPLGWKGISWINQVAVLPLFDLFSRWFDNFGIIILLLTIVIKTVIFPFTYKSYISSAKMRVLKPEIDEINKRIPADKMQERQQATMALYSKVGVSPMSGCLPMVFQMPILFAMFQFFPTSIELRQESFLWATDLSSYDSIFDLPFTIPFYGSHVSLFCLLMTVTNIIYTKINMASQAGNDQMAIMKWMMYLMPIMFLFVFNSYASGLSYYYFLSLLITIIQTYLIRLTVDDEKLLAQLHAKREKNEKNPKKKSGFAARLEAMQREQQRLMREQSKKTKR